MPLQWLLSIVVIFLAVGYGIVVWQRAWIFRFHEFLGEVKGELKKVNWPARKEVIGTTSVVIATVFFFGVYLSLIDVAVTWVRTAIFAAAKAGGSTL